MAATTYFTTQYTSELKELVTADKAKITGLSMIAEANKALAPQVVSVIDRHLRVVSRRPAAPRIPRTCACLQTAPAFALRAPSLSPHLPSRAPPLPGVQH